MVIAMILLPLMDVVAKHLGKTMPTGQLAWSRFLFQTLLLAPFAWRLRSHMRLFQWQLHALRGFLIAAATLCFFTSLTRLPIADAIAIFFVEPLILTLLSPLFLGEKVGWRRLSAVMAGFIGAIIIIKPGANVFGFYSLLPLAAACCFAFYLILTRKLAQQIDPVLIQFYTGLSGLATMSAALLLGSLWSVDFLTPVWPSSIQWGFMALLGTIGCVGHLLVVHAFRILDAATLAPFQYFEIIGAVVFGWYFFSDIPTATTWLGIAIITGSGFYVYWREQVVLTRIIHRA